MTPLNPGDRPKYMVPRKLAGGRIAWYWAPPAHVMAWGAPLERRPLGSDYAEAVKLAVSYNEALDFWRINKRLPGEAPPPPGIIPGSLDDVFETFQTHAPSRPHSFAQLEPGTQADYKRLMKRFADYVLKDGRRVGEVRAVDLDPATVDAIYEKLLYDEGGNARRRVTNHMIAACRRAWNVARRAKPNLVPAGNPFEKMSLDHSSAPTKPATIADLQAFETKAAERASRGSYFSGQRKHAGRSRGRTGARQITPTPFFWASKKTTTRFGNHWANATTTGTGCRTTPNWRNA